MKALFSILIVLFSMSAVASLPKYVSAEKMKEVSLTQGSTTVIDLAFLVVKGFHIQANPASEPRLIATALTIVDSDSIKADTAVYPPGKPFRLKGSNADIATFEGRFVIKVPIIVRATATPGKASLGAQLRYQACNEKNCFFPTTLNFAIPLEIVQSEKK